MVDVTLSMLGVLPGRIPLVGLVAAPLFIRVSCSLSKSCTSYASKGKGVNDDLLCTDKPVTKKTDGEVFLEYSTLRENETHN